MTFAAAEPRRMVALFCDNCGEKWEYTGDKPTGAYVDCPQCGHDVEISEFGE